VLKVDIDNAKENYSFDVSAVNTQSLFTEVTKAVGINYKHNDVDFADFNVQKLLPHKLSEYSPAVAVGDVDGNGFDDMVVGGTSKYPAQVLLQQANGKFIQRNLLATATNLTDKYKDEGLLLFDADGDGDLDLYAASGGYEDEPGSKSYQDRIYAERWQRQLYLTARCFTGQFYQQTVC
jgi:hypothetical protein